MTCARRKVRAQPGSSKVRWIHRGEPEVVRAALRQLERPRMLSVSIKSSRGALGSVRRRVGSIASPSLHRATPGQAFKAGHPVGRCGNRRLPASPPGLPRQAPPEGSGRVHRRQGRGSPRWLSRDRELPGLAHMGQNPQPQACCAAPGRLMVLKGARKRAGVRCAGSAPENPSGQT